ncbi:hypothetical protein [Azospirillum sp. TSH58]|uniref:hypothetical protein n=1 Tax=Azospirillum sp. TSH58 TaxID=664962 RepID=UPI0011B1E64C|nr:hypothetical protein [Azospirillum sp. TSH58]
MGLIESQFRLVLRRMKFSLSAETCWAAVGITCCISVALALAPKSDWFLKNALFYLVTQMLVVLAALIGRPRPSAIGGVAVAASLYLAAFGMWAKAAKDSMAWLGYVFSLPGAILGALAIVFWLKSKSQMAPFTTFCISAVAVIFGVSINQTAICKTLMYCSIPWK